MIDPNKGVEFPGIELINDLPAPDAGTDKGDDKDDKKKPDIQEPGDDKKLPEKTKAQENEEDEPEPEKKKPGRPKKDNPPADPDPDPEPDPADDEDEESVVQTLAKKLGYEIGEEEEYEDSYDGLAKFIENASVRRADEQLGEFFEQYPVAGEFFDWLTMGGKPEDFFKVQNPEIDFSSVDVSSEDVQKSVLRSWYRKNDYTEEEITEALTDLEASGLIEKEAKRAVSKLKLVQEREREELMEQQKAEQAQRQRQIQTYWKNVETTLDKGTVKGLSIPEKEKKELFKYMAQPIKGGKSQEMIDAEQEDIEARIALAFLRKNKFDLGKLIDRTATTKRASELKEALKRKSDKLKSGDPRNEVGKDVPEIDLKYMQ